MSTVTIKHEATRLYVEIQVDTSTYLLSQEQYAELWHTALQHPPADVLWASYVTKEFIDPAHVEQAVDELNDFVANTCMEYAPEDEEEDNE
jgi:hypothetical protein